MLWLAYVKGLVIRFRWPPLRPWHEDEVYFINFVWFWWILWGGVLLGA
jgi:hypothetical protein